MARRRSAKGLFLKASFTLASSFRHDCVARLPSIQIAKTTERETIAMSVRTATAPILSAVLVGSMACSGTATGPSSAATVLVSVMPTGGAASISTSAPIVIGFSHAMTSVMEMYVSLHEGDVTGPTVPCVATWSSDRTTLTFTPSASLKSATVYTLHVGGGMKDADGNSIDMTAHGMMGGQWATSSMMNGGGMMSGQEMGPGWLGSNGMYGMVFRFTTA